MELAREHIYAIINPKWFEKGYVEFDFTNEICLTKNYTRNLIKNAEARLGVGKYAEDRIIYNYEQYKSGDEPRTVHLGIDLDLPASEPIYAPIGGSVHSFADNAQAGNYGPTIILQHNIDGSTFHTLYGHLNRKCLNKLKVGREIFAGENFAYIGSHSENGGWAPHLHFQIILDIGEHFGDYPGVCKKSEQEFYLKNSPDPKVLIPLLNSQPKNWLAP